MAHGPAAMARSLGLSPAWNDRQLRNANSSPSGAGKRTRRAGPAASASATTVFVVPKSMPSERAEADIFAAPPERGRAPYQLQCHPASRVSGCPRPMRTKRGKLMAESGAYGSRSFACVKTGMTAAASAVDLHQRAVVGADRGHVQDA